MRKSSEAIRVLTDGPGQDIVHLSRQADPFRTIDQVSARTGGRKHLDRDAGLIHFSQASGPQIRQLFVRPSPAPNRKAAPRNRARIDFSYQPGDREMLLESDDAHSGVTIAAANNSSVHASDA